MVACPSLLPDAEQMAKACSNLWEAGFHATKRFILAKTMPE